MNSYYLVTSLLKSILSSNDMVATVVHGRTEDTDLYKKSLYPLAHLVPVGAPFNSSQINTFIFDIAVLDQREITKAKEEDKFEGNDNLLDNLNTCHSILNHLIANLRRQNNDEMIELVTVGDAEPLLFKSHNTLDGWVVRLTLSIPNTTISAC